MIQKIKEHLERKALGLNLYFTDAELLEEAYYELLMLSQDLERAEQGDLREL
ncbi:MAG: hypothetical protein ACOYOV_00120 [Bacteroidales bacterium]